MKNFRMPFGALVAMALVLVTAPAAATLWKWSTTAASNANSDSTINWAEGQSPGSVNDSARAMMAAVAKYRDDVANAGTTGGTASAYTLTTTQSLTVLTNKFSVALTAHAANNAGATIAVDGLTAKPLATTSGDAIGAGVLAQGGRYTISYDSGEDEWVVHSIQADPSPFPVGAYLDYSGSSAPSGWLLANGQAVSRTTYADLFTLLSTTYGVGDGSTTFNLPDFRGRVAAGSDTMGTTAASRLTATTMSGNGQGLGETGGTETHALITAELAAHTHSGSTLTASSAGAHTHGTTEPAHTHLSNDYRTGVQAPVGTGQGLISAGTLTNYTTGGEVTGLTINSDGTHSHPVSGNTGSTGSGDAHLNIQPTLITYKIIKF